MLLAVGQDPCAGLHTCPQSSLGPADPNLGGSPLQPMVVSTPMSSVDTPGGSGHATEIQTALKYKQPCLFASRKAPGK